MALDLLLGQPIEAMEEQSDIERLVGIEAVAAGQVGLVHAIARKCRVLQLDFPKPSDHVTAWLAVWPAMVLRALSRLWP